MGGCAGMLLLALDDIQSLLASPDLSAELLFVLALVLSLCSVRWPGDDGVVRSNPFPSVSFTSCPELTALLSSHCVVLWVSRTVTHPLGTFGTSPRSKIVFVDCLSEELYCTVSSCAADHVAP